ncbi:MAG: putative rane protein [Myxococcaceae bacterium]|nr:putative rane protein [Myxococcaceae bacterium]
MSEASREVARGGWAERAFSRPVEGGSQRWWYGAVALLGLALAAWHARSLGRPVFPVDDAYITLHNALALGAGRDPNFAGVSPLVGATSSAHLAFVALLCLALPPLWALFAAAWLAAIAYALGVLRMAFLHRASPLQSVLLLLAAVVVGRVPHQLMNGLETGLTLAAMVWTLNLADEPGRRRAAAVACGVLPFLRPELGAFSAPVLLVVMLRRRRDDPSTSPLRGAAESLALALLGALPWLLWNRLGVGAFLPSTVLAKRAFFSEGCLPPAVKWDWIKGSIADFLRQVGVLSRALLLGLVSPLGRTGLLLLAALALAYYANFPGALGHYEHRYLYVLIPPMLYAVAACFEHRSALLRGGATALLLLSVEQSSWEVRDRWQQYLNNRAFTAAELEGVASFCRHNLPAGSRVLLHDVGYMSWGTAFQLVDFVGLKSPSSAVLHQSMTWPTCGARRGEAIHLIATREHPNYLVVLNGWDRIYRFSDSLRARGWGLTSLRPPDVAYSVYRLTPPPDGPAPR